MYFKKDKNKNSFFKILFVKKCCFILDQKLHNKTSQVAQFLKFKLDFQGFFFSSFQSHFFPFDPQPLAPIAPVTDFPTAFPHAFFQNTGDAGPGGRALTWHVPELN